MTKLNINVSAAAGFDRNDDTVTIALPYEAAEYVRAELEERQISHPDLGGKNVIDALDEGLRLLDEAREERDS